MTKTRCVKGLNFGKVLVFITNSPFLQHLDIQKSNQFRKKGVSNLVSMAGMGSDLKHSVWQSAKVAGPWALVLHLVLLLLLLPRSRRRRLCHPEMRWFFFNGISTPVEARQMGQAALGVRCTPLDSLSNAKSFSNDGANSTKSGWTSMERTLYFSRSIPTWPTVPPTTTLNDGFNL